MFSFLDDPAYLETSNSNRLLFRTHSFSYVFLFPLLLETVANASDRQANLAEFPSKVSTAFSITTAQVSEFQ
jgi:hypothetical protein